MSHINNVKINNTVVLATVVELTKSIVKMLDGDGIDTQNEENMVTDDVLNKLIASRIRNRIAQRT